MSTHSLIEEHIFLTEVIAFDYANIPGCHWEDARSEASIALVRAAEAYDPAKGEFVSFSSRVIRNALNSLYAKQLRLLKIFPKSIDDPIQFASVENRDLTGLSTDGDFVIEPGQDLRKAVRLRETSNVIETLMNLLSPRERVVVGALKTGYSYAEIGESLGISKQAAHKSAKSGLGKLRAGLDRLGFQGIASDGLLASRGSKKENRSG
jgi:RNA polymerase sigma factor (sigma-70 family)